MSGIRLASKFSAVWSDMVLKQSANCHTKSKLGGTKVTIKTTKTHNNWWITAHKRAAICDKTRKRLKINERVAPGQGKSKYQHGRDKSNIQSLFSILGNIISNLFDMKQDEKGHLKILLLV